MNAGEVLDALASRWPRMSTGTVLDLAPYVSSYRIPIVPEGHRLCVFSDIALYEVRIERTGPDWRGVNPSEDTWAVRDRSRTWARHNSRSKITSGTWEYEAIPSERTNAWFRRSRFTLNEAHEIVTTLLPGLLADLDRRYGARADERAAEKANARG